MPRDRWTCIGTQRIYRITVIMSDCRSDDPGSTPGISAIWGVSSVGRAAALQAEDHRFDSDTLHNFSNMVSLVQLVECITVDDEVVGARPT